MTPRSLMFGTEEKYFPAATGHKEGVQQRHWEDGSCAICRIVMFCILVACVFYTPQVYVNYDDRIGSAL